MSRTHPSSRLSTGQLLTSKVYLRPAKIALIRWNNVIFCRQGSCQPNCSSPFFLDDAPVSILDLNLVSACFLLLCSIDTWTWVITPRRSRMLLSGYVIVLFTYCYFSNTSRKLDNRRWKDHHGRSRRKSIDKGVHPSYHWETHCCLIDPVLEFSTVVADDDGCVVP